MLKRYRNLVAEEIQNAGMALADFHPTEHDSTTFEAFSIHYKNPKFSFTFQLRDSQGRHTFLIHSNRFTSLIPTETFRAVSPTTWVAELGLRTELQEWLAKELPKYDAAKRDFEADADLPDLWSTGEKDSLPAVETDNNAPFSLAEVERIKTSLDELRDEVRAKPDLLTAEQFNLLSTRLDEMIDSASRLGRKDWLNAVIGGFTGFAIQATLTAEVTRELFTLASHALSWIGGAAPLLLPS